VSILLEALRKSENSQRRAKPPGINDDVPAPPARAHLRPVLLVAMLVLALAASGWFIWRQYRPPAGYQPPVSLPAGSRTPVEEPLAAAPAQPGAGSARKAATPPQKPVSGSRTPVESFKPPAAADAAKTRSEPAVRADAAKAAGKAAADRGPAPAEDRDRQARNKVFEPQEPAPISYWELPDSVRAQVPEIKFTVLVYARRPQDRFVLIEGQRLAEGDSLPSGPKIVEIRLDGVVFSYRLYRFLVAR